MLTSIEIVGEATYPPSGAKLSELRKINYLFGHNGCGKTTISRAIHDPSARPGYNVAWADGRAIPTFVYNRDFAEANFGEQMRGIFTLGEESIRAAEEVSRLQAEISKITREIDSLGRQLNGEGGAGGRCAELLAARSALEDACWESQRSHKGAFEVAFTGHRGSKSAFCSKLLAEHQTNSADLVAHTDLTFQAATVYRSSALTVATIDLPSFDGLALIEAHEILRRRIVGRDDVVVAGLIRRLENSDWVKQGVPFLRIAEGSCPFCQQPAPPDLLDSLNAFFDAQYESDISQIASLAAQYAERTLNIDKRINSIISTPHLFLNAELLAERYQVFKSIVDLNHDRLILKRREPSSEVALEATAHAGEAISALLIAANEQARA